MMTHLPSLCAKFLNISRISSSVYVILFCCSFNSFNRELLVFVVLLRYEKDIKLL